MVGELVESCRRAGVVGPLRKVSDDLCVEDEWEMVTWALSFFDSHRALPTSAAIREAGFTPSRNRPDIDPPDYFLDRMRTRAAFNAVSSSHPAFRSAMEARDMDEVERILSAMIHQARRFRDSSHAITMEEGLRQVNADVSEAQGAVGLRGVTLGFPPLDEITAGAQAGEVVVICGRAGAGKTYAMAKMAQDAWLGGATVGLVSMEMSTLPLARRMAGICTGVNPKLLRTGEVSTHAQRRIEAMAERYASSPNRFYLESGDFDKNVSYLDRYFDEYGCDALYVDSAYLMTPTQVSRGASLWERIAQIVKDLKKLSLRHEKPVILTMQLNRNVKSSSRTMDLRDIAGSDTVGQDASIILGVLQHPTGNPNRRMMVTAKNRDGEMASFAYCYEFAPVNFSVVIEEDEYRYNDGQANNITGMEQGERW